jgi:hypothetical protein
MLVIYYVKESAGDEIFKDFGEDGKKVYRAVGCGCIGGFARFKDEDDLGYFPLVREVDEVE